MGKKCCGKLSKLGIDYSGIVRIPYFAKRQDRENFLRKRKNDIKKKELQEQAAKEQAAKEQAVPAPEEAEVEPPELKVLPELPQDDATPQEYWWDTPEEPSKEDELD